jgi:hypothetical protein
MILKKPTPEQVAQLREAYPKGAPRVDYREMDLSAITRAATDTETDNRVRVAISSEAPVLRYDWWADEAYYEVLDHSEKSVDLSYAKDGMPFVASHRAWDADQQHGIVEDVAVASKRLVGAVRFSKAVRSQEIAQDILDGIRKKVSVGYIIGDDFEQTAGEAGDFPTRRYTNWMPIETSTVPIPADYSVGIGRAMMPTTREAFVRFLSTHPPKGRTDEEVAGMIRYCQARLKLALSA